MNVRKIILWLLLLFGEAVIITAFILFKDGTPNNILILNIVVSSIIYGAFFIDILVPWVNFNDESHRRVGSLGVRWFVTLFYASIAIVLMVAANTCYEVTFSTQLIIHCGLLFLFMLGLWAAVHSSDKVRSVYEQEKAHRSGIIEMKNAMRELKDKMNELNDLPDYFIQQINTLETNLRFISPANNHEAHTLESSFVEIVSDIKFAISDFSMNEEQIVNHLKKLERIYQNRRNIYSN